MLLTVLMSTVIEGGNWDVHVLSVQQNYDKCEKAFNLRGSSVKSHRSCPCQSDSDLPAVLQLNPS